jgi:hypothetical protein
MTSVGDISVYFYQRNGPHDLAFSVWAEHIRSARLFRTWACGNSHFADGYTNKVQ